VVINQLPAINRAVTNNRAVISTAAADILKRQGISKIPATSKTLVINKTPAINKTRDIKSHISRRSPRLINRLRSPLSNLPLSRLLSLLLNQLSRMAGRSAPAIQ
jgi:hypothetical protein